MSSPGFRLARVSRWSASRRSRSIRASCSRPAAGKGLTPSGRGHSVPEAGVVVRKPIWTSSSFLLYTGGFIVLFSAAGALVYLSTQYGQGALVAWTLIPLGVLLALALGFQRRGWWIAAGVFAFATVSIWGTFWGEMFEWWGWTPSGSSGPFDGFNWSIWLLALLVLVAAFAALRRFRFPLLIIFVIESIYYVVTDFISNGGTWSVVVTLFFGFLFFIIGVTLDRGP